MLGVAEARSDPREVRTVARKRYGQTIRMYETLHRDVNVIAAHYGVAAQDIYHALTTDRVGRLIQRMMEERMGKKPSGGFAVTISEEFGIEWAKPGRGASAAIEPPAEPEPHPRSRRPK